MGERWISQLEAGDEVDLWAEIPAGEDENGVPLIHPARWLRGIALWKVEHQDALDLVRSGVTMPVWRIDIGGGRSVLATWLPKNARDRWPVFTPDPHRKTSPKPFGDRIAMESPPGLCSYELGKRRQ